MNRLRVAATLLLLAPGARGVDAAAPRGSLTIERIAAIKLPSSATWSPDGERIVFLWDDAGNQNLFLVEPGGPPVRLTQFAPDPESLTGDIDAFEWVSNEEMLVLRNGGLNRISTDGASEPMSSVTGVQSFALSPDRRQVALVQGGKIIVMEVGGGSRRTLTDLPDGLRAGSPVFSRDGGWIAFTASRVERVADFLGYNGNKQALYRNEIDDRRVGILDTGSGETVWIPEAGRASDLQWTHEGQLLYQSISPDMKTREIRVASLLGVRTLRSDHDERWWSPLRRDAKTMVSPDGKMVAFFADESGWTHLYIMPTGGSEAGAAARELTSGEFETGFGSWSSDSRSIAFYHGKGSLMERFISMVDVENGSITDVVTEKGVSYWPRLSPDGSRVVYEHTDVENSVDLYLAEVASDARPQRLTRSMPSEIDKADLTAPQPVHFPSRVDGQSIPGTLFVPEHLDRARKHPAIVWIHGSGSDQNFLGWHPFSYRMYYSANQYLAQQGYVILAVDYRGSSGYGRDWGTGHHLDLGGPDALDVASGADYLKTLPYVDAGRIGVWGLSYGGFLTLQALTVTPELFRCGIDVAGVTDWTTWGLESNGGWITGRMSTPEANPEGYHRTAPVNHMESLTRPLLILHGTADVNVAFRESLNLVDVLLKMGKDFDFELYPGELHFFRRTHILRDAWKRAETFFDTHLKQAPPTPSQ